MTSEQQAMLKREIEALLHETQDKEDAIQYLDEVVKDVDCTWEEAMSELERQCDTQEKKN